MTTNQEKKLINASVEIYHAAAGENPELRFQVQATHTSMGLVQLCYTNKTDADTAAGFINQFGVCPPSPTAESERRLQLEGLVENHILDIMPKI